MKIAELIGYRKNPIYTKVRSLLSKSAISKAGEYAFDKSDQRKRQLSKFTDFLKRHGFENLGTGSFGAVYEKPGYPWVFKVFTGDPAYKRYIDFVLRNQGNLYVPKIKGGIIKINQNTYAVRMEKLAPMTNSVSQKVSKLYWILRNLNRASGMTRAELEWMEKNYPEILGILNALSRVSGDRFDIHHKNIMMRGKTPVLIDPIVNLRTL